MSEKNINDLFKDFDENFKDFDKKFEEAAEEAYKKIKKEKQKNNN